MTKSLIYELESPLNLRQQEVSLDEDKIAADEVYAQTIYSAVSTGTEVAAWLGKPPLRPSTVYPRLIGYCNLAKVNRVGQAVKDVHAGDYILTHQSHRTTFICPRSDVLYSTCESNESMLKKLTATYLYHLGYSALLTGDFRPGYQVAIVGMGTLGITTASLAAAFGCQPFIFSDQPVSDRPSAALERFLFFRKDSFDFAQLNKFCGMDGVDLVVNTSNKWSDHLLSLQLARKGGTIVCLGFPGRGEPLPDFNPLTTQYFYDRQLALKYCGYTTDCELPEADIRFTKKRNMRYLASLVLSGVINPLEILSLEARWTELGMVYEALAARRQGIYSALIEWRT